MRAFPLHGVLLSTMLSALMQAIVDVGRPELRRISVLCIAITVGVFIALWVAAGVAIANISLFDWRWLDRLVGLLGAVAALGLTWLVFPAVCTMVFGLFLDRIATQVEAVHYPHLAPPRRLSIRASVTATARLMSLTAVLNLLALPIYLFAPVANIFVFLALNGYLLGREYFEAVAFRRLDPILVRAARRRLAGRVFLGGVIIAGTFAVPVVNLIGPVIATALMVHMFVEHLQNEPPLITR